MQEETESDERNKIYTSKHRKLDIWGEESKKNKWRNNTRRLYIAAFSNTNHLGRSCGLAPHPREEKKYVETIFWYV